MNNRIVIIFILFLFVGIGNLLAQNGICESGELPSNPDCNGVCDPGDSSSGPDCNGVCDPGDSSSGPDCNGLCDPGESSSSVDCNGICDPGEAPSSVDCDPLPIELSSFIVAQVDEFIQLKWETRSELNNKKFVIERSVSGTDFIAIGEVNGSGNSNQVQKYSYKDENPERGIIYYRLKQIDFDGQFTFSRIRSSNFESNNWTVELYPNPSHSGLVNLKYRSSLEEQVGVYLYDLTGKLVQLDLYFATSGVNILELDYSSILTGMYTVQLKNNESVEYRRLILK